MYGESGGEGREGLPVGMAHPLGKALVRKAPSKRPTTSGVFSPPALATTQPPGYPTMHPSSP